MKSLDLLDTGWEDGASDDSSARAEVRAANMLRALANPHRLKILKLLDKAPHNVMELCGRLNLRQSLASQHLARLRLDGIVTAERKGHHVIYSIGNARAREILAVLEGEKARKSKRSTRKGGANGHAVTATSRTPS